MSNRPSLNCLIHFYKRCVSGPVWHKSNRYLLSSGLKRVHSTIFGLYCETVTRMCCVWMTVFCGAFWPCYCQEILTGQLCPSLLDPLVWPVSPCLNWPSYHLLDSLPQEVCDSHHLSLEYMARFLLDWGKSSQNIELTRHSLSTAISCWKHQFSSDHWS